MDDPLKTWPSKHQTEVWNRIFSGYIKVICSPMLPFQEHWHPTWMTELAKWIGKGELLIPKLSQAEAWLNMIWCGLTPQFLVDYDWAPDWSWLIPATVPGKWLQPWLISPDKSRLNSSGRLIFTQPLGRTGWCPPPMMNLFVNPTSPGYNFHSP